AIEAAFAAEYARLYTHVYTGTVIQAINWRVLTAGPAPTIDVEGQEGVTASRTARKGERPAYFPEAGGSIPTPVYDRYALASGEVLVGPAILGERESTAVVPPGDRLEVDARGNLRIRVARTTSLEAVVPAGLDLAQAIARIEADPVGLEIMWSRLINIVEECWLTVW